MQPTAVKFAYSAFWIRVFNLPIKSMIREVGEDIGRGIGNLVEVDALDNGLGWGKYLCIRVEVDVSEPLLRGKILMREDGDDASPFWVDFKYEHLPIFCYKCGRLGHSSSECLEGRGSTRTEDIFGKQWGSWLWAPIVRPAQPRRNRPSMHQYEDDDREISGNHDGDGTAEEVSRPPVLGDDERHREAESQHVARPEIVEEIDSNMLETRDPLHTRFSDEDNANQTPPLFGMASGGDRSREIWGEGDKNEVVVVTAHIPTIVLDSGVPVGPNEQEAHLHVHETQAHHEVAAGPPKLSTWKK